MSRFDQVIGLDPDARRVICAYGLTVQEYVQFFSDAATWPGDSCGCPDDRCRGHHHGKSESCGCLESHLADLARMDGPR